MTANLRLCQVVLRKVGLRSVPSALADVCNTLQELDLDENKDLQVCEDSLALLRQLRELQMLSLCKEHGR